MPRTAAEVKTYGTKKVGLLVMAYGTPYQEEDIIPYYTHIRHGKRPSDDMIEDLKNATSISAESLRSRKLRSLRQKSWKNVERAPR